MLNKVFGNLKQNMCILCLTEKLWIINFTHDNNYLNKKSFQNIQLSRCNEKQRNKAERIYL